MRTKLLEWQLKAMIGWKHFWEDTSGETNIIAITLLILVVIAVVAIFRTGMTEIITDLIEKIKGEM